MTISFACDESTAGQRLDKALALHDQIRTRSRAAFLIDEKLVHVNGKPGKASLLLKLGDRIELSLPEAEPSELQPYDFPLDILFEDDHVIVINKPSGLVVHPAAGHAQDTLVNALLNHTQRLSMKFGQQRPGIVHRLDKETSGVLVVAKNDFAHERLTQQFKDRTIHRVYFAVTLGHPKVAAGKITSYLARHPVDRKRYASILSEDKKIQTTIEPALEVGKWAATGYEVLISKSGLNYCRLKLETGRTHQIRVHMSELGLPIAGDTLYGADKKIKSLASVATQKDIRHLQRFLLHAAELQFVHPVSEQTLSFKTDWPDDIRQLLLRWGLREDH
ncbi:MAG: RluA family pseudouridine synthase [Proteobacteria bacterium]|nr:MAG: RluA family pseudouridine synthase [Pseudomonadota bacterium]